MLKLRSMPLIFLCGLICFLIIARSAWCQANANQPAKPGPQATQAGEGGRKNAGDKHDLGSTENTAVEKQLVKVVVTTSRPEVTRDHAWGLSADITNVSDGTLILFAREVQLVMEPEATKSAYSIAYGSFLPNTSSEIKGSDEQIVLDPGEHYMFFWDGKEAGTDESSGVLANWKKFQETLNFTPGPYSFVVEGKVHRAKPDNNNQPIQAEEAYHTFAQAVTVKISIPQLAILLWAGFGSILGYLVVGLREGGEIAQISVAATGKDRAKAAANVLIGLCSAFLIGSILSIVANRLSDTQFPVKVSVNDVWGSITVGFVFFFVGSKVIDKLRSLVPTTQSSNPGQGQASPAQAAPAQAPPDQGPLDQSPPDR